MKFGLLERTNAEGILYLSSPLLGTEVDACQELCSEGMLVEVELDIYKITNKGREFLKSQTVPLGEW